MDENVLFLVLFTDSEDPVLDLEARSVNSSDHNEELSLILRGWMQISRRVPRQSSFLSVPLLRNCLMLSLVLLPDEKASDCGLKIAFSHLHECSLPAAISLR